MKFLASVGHLLRANRLLSAVQDLRSGLEPVRLRALLVAVVALAGGFGLNTFTEAEIDALVIVVMAVASLVAGESARAQVMPVKSAERLVAEAVKAAKPRRKPVARKGGR